jgi:tellurite resistance protein
VVGIRYRLEAATSFVRGAWAAHQRGKAYGLTSRPEPDNQWDPNAIAIDGFFSTMLGPKAVHIGYLPAEIAEELQGRDYRVAMVSGYLGDGDFVDVELVVLVRREIEDVFAKIDKEAQREWVRDFAMPGLKILAHIAAADGGTDEHERQAMSEYADRVRRFSGSVIDDEAIARAISDALAMAPSMESLRASYRKLSKHADAAGDLLQCALKLAKLGGLHAAEAKALQELLTIERKVNPQG